MDSKALQRDFTEDPNGIRKDSKAFQKGIHYSTHCKGIHRNLKAFQRALRILREFDESARDEQCPGNVRQNGRFA